MVRMKAYLKMEFQKGTTVKTKTALMRWKTMLKNDVLENVLRFRWFNYLEMQMNLFFHLYFS